MMDVMMGGHFDLQDLVRDQREFKQLLKLENSNMIRCITSALRVNKFTEAIDAVKLPKGMHYVTLRSK